MSKISKLELQLEYDIDEHYHYNAGEEVRGTILLGLKEKFCLRYLTVTICGNGSVRWTENKQEEFQAKETYVNEKLQVAPQENFDTLILNAGMHEFPFHYKLPKELPSSFIGKFGNVTYILKVALKEDSQFGLSSFLTSEPILVLNHRSLSVFMNNKPITKKTDQRFWAKFLRSGKIYATLTINKTIYKPGEDIIMNAEILNRSPKFVEGLSAMLLLYTTFSAQSNKHTHIQVVGKRRDNWQLSSGEGRRWRDAKMTIPTYAPESRLDGCDIIDIKYELVLRVETEELKRELKLTMPIEVSQSEDTKIPNGSAITSNYGDTYKSYGSTMTLDKATLQKMSIDKLLQLQGDNNGEIFNYDRPITDGTLRVNPLYQPAVATKINDEDADTAF